jgi:chorismate synthase
MSSLYGQKIKLSIFGQSHSSAIGMSLDGLPAGIFIDLGELQAFLKRRRPGQSELTTARAEEDVPEVLSGLVNGVTCGAPLAIIIRNTDTRSADYQNVRDIPRPSHADYAAHVKFGGHQDVAGGGHFSGRLTAPLCAAGGICLQVLRGTGVEVGARIVQMGDILAAKKAGDSVGGIIECKAIGLPVGLGDPIFGGIENRIAGIVFGIPGIKGIEFGSGFAGCLRKGSEENDSFYYTEDGKIQTRTNNSGGVQGGITNGMPVVFRVAVKPTPSIGVEQESVSLSRGENAVLQIKGRHDPCIVPRAVPCVEAAAAVALYDAYLSR